MKYLLKRLGFYSLAAFFAVTFNFFLPRLMPGDAAGAMFARFQGRLTPEALEALRRAFGATDGAAVPAVLPVPARSGARELRGVGQPVPRAGAGRGVDGPGVDGAGGRLGVDHRLHHRHGPGDHGRLEARRLHRRGAAAGARLHRRLSLLLAGDGVAVRLRLRAGAGCRCGTPTATARRPRGRFALRRRRGPARGAARLHGGGGDARRLVDGHAQRDGGGAGHRVPRAGPRQGAVDLAASPGATRRATRCCPTSPAWACRWASCWAARC